jgi:hypothetical protein
MIFPKLFKGKKKETKSGVKIVADELYNYSDLERREATIRFLYSYAKTGRSSWEEYWSLMRRYYDGEHDTPKQMAAFVQSQGLPWNPTQCTDGYIHVETQIDPTIPEFEFSGRDDDADSTKAKTRENVVRFVLDNNPMELMNTRNERRMNIYGLAAWKVPWDNTIEKPGISGDIVISNPKMTQLFLDPTATEDIDDCEYLGFVYRMHKMKAKRYFAKDLNRVGKNINDFATGYGIEDTEFMKSRDEYDSTTFDNPDDTLQIMEWWFRQPEDGSETIEGLKYEWKAGDIACVILINEEEVRFIPKYWRKTNCSMYPFSVYCKVPNDDYIWGKSEIEMIKDLIDSTDRQLAYAQLNDAFTANDIIIMEENALADNTDFQNVPGGLVKTKTGQINNVRRLAGLTSTHIQMYESAAKYKEYMQQTNGNFDINQGGEANLKVTTATGLAILNDRSQSRQGIKKADRSYGMERLIKLIDYTALEYYNDNRMIFIGAKSKDAQAISFPYNSDEMMIPGKDGDYYPIVDVKMHLSDGLKRSKAFTSQALQELAKMQITPENYKFIQAYIETIDIPQKVELNDFIEQVVGQLQQAEQMAAMGQGPGGISMQQILEQGGFSPEELDILEQQPELAHQAAKENGVQITG